MEAVLKDGKVDAMDSKRSANCQVTVTTKFKLGVVFCVSRIAVLIYSRLQVQLRHRHNVPSTVNYFFLDLLDLVVAFHLRMGY